MSRGSWNVSFDNSYGCRLPVYTESSSKDSYSRESNEQSDNHIFGGYSGYRCFNTTSDDKPYTTAIIGLTNPETFEILDNILDDMLVSPVVMDNTQMVKSLDKMSQIIDNTLSDKNLKLLKEMHISNSIFED
jgi:hypothetical protein